MDIDTRARGGTGIGSGCDAWGEDAIDRKSAITNVKINHCRMLVDKHHGWTTDSGATVSQVTIEFWNTDLDNLEIGNNELDGVCSIMSESGKARIHHTLFDHCGYTIEMMQPNLEFDHNYIRGGGYALANFGKDSTFPNLNVHHNVFITGKGSGFNVTRGVDNNWFEGTKPAGTNVRMGKTPLNLSGAKPFPYYAPRKGSPLINAGIPIPGLTNDRKGKSSDLGAFAYGEPPWNAGSRKGK